MGKAISSEFETAVEQSVVRPRFFFEGEFSSGIQNYWTGLGSVSWDSKTWLGNGSLINFSSISESNNLSENTIEINLIGESSALVSLMLNELKHNQECRLYFGLIDNLGEIILDPFLLYIGFLDSIVFDDSADSCALKLTYGSKLNLLTKSKALRYNNETQHIFDSNDIGFEYMEQLQDWTGYWGKPRKKKKKKRENP